MLSAPSSASVTTWSSSPARFASDAPTARAASTSRSGAPFSAARMMLFRSRSSSGSVPAVEMTRSTSACDATASPLPTHQGLDRFHRGLRIIAPIIPLILMTGRGHRQGEVEPQTFLVIGPLHTERIHRGAPLTEGTGPRVHPGQYQPAEHLRGNRHG